MTTADRLRRALPWVASHAAVALVAFVLTRAYYQPAPPPVEAKPVAAPSATGSSPLGMSMQRFAADVDPRIEAAAKDPAKLADLGDEYFSKSDYRQAIELYQRAIALNPRDADSHNDMGLALMYLGRGQEAIAVLEKGVAVDPKFQRIWLTKGFVHARLGQDQEAAAALGKARDLGPKNEIGVEAQRLLDMLR